MGRKSKDMFEGAIFNTNHSGLAEVIDYKGKYQTIIKFLDTGNIRTTNSSQLRAGSVRDREAFSVYGVGRYDIPDEEKHYYKRWLGMLSRCYGENASYAGCTVHQDWLTFSVFKAWVKSAEKEYGYTMPEQYQLDKDLIKKGNRQYSAKTCCLLPPKVNTFIRAGVANRCVLCRRSGKWISYCENLDNKCQFLGRYASKEIAEAVGLGYKIKVAEDLSLTVKHPLLRRKIVAYYKKGEEE